MKKFFLLWLHVCSFLLTYAQNYWTGAAGDHLWETTGNWSAGVPISTDEVIIDNSTETGSFIIALPSTSTTVHIARLQITPGYNDSITLTLPNTNTANPGLNVTGGIIISNRGILQNSTGTGAGGTGISTAVLQINNGGRFIHNNTRTHAALVSSLSTIAGTENGIFEFNVPTAGGYVISASGRNFGDLVFNATAAGGSKTYTASGAADLTIRGNLIVNNGTTFNSVLESNIRIAGNLSIHGNFFNAPSTAGTTRRSILLEGTTYQTISGTGNFTFNSNFRNIEVNTHAHVVLQRNINLSNATHQFILNTGGVLQTGIQTIEGNGAFVQQPASLLGIGSAEGITQIPSNTGNVQTATRVFNSNASFEYNGVTAQETGNALPTSVKKLIVNNSVKEKIRLTHSIAIDDSLVLQSGYLLTTTSSLPVLRDTTEIVSPGSQYLIHAGMHNIGWEGSFIDGPVQAMMDIAGTTRWFPTGEIAGISPNTDTLFAPIQLVKSVNGLVTYSAEYIASSYPETVVNPEHLHHISEVEHWLINANGNNADAKISLSWRPASRVSGNNNPPAFDSLMICHYFDDDENGPNHALWHVDGGSNIVMPKYPGYTADYGILTTVFPTGNFSPFTLGTRGNLHILPVEYIKLYSIPQPSNVLLKWEIEGYQELSNCLIEHSKNGMDFTSIGNVSIQQNMPRQSYTFTDTKPYSGWNFYRVKIIDSAGNANYSSISKAWVGLSNQLQIYPNPCSSILTINFPASSSTSHIRVVNSTGRTIQQWTTNNRLLVIDVSPLPTGVYFIQWINDKATIHQAFLKQ